ncbi:unnamed protein product [Pedinophyceae sp. YPF-701]|nr:unnamed protein product [Pedinophyceae sp. YPF-701]
MRALHVHYEGTLEDGTVFDSSRPREKPLEFIVGAGTVVRGFDKLVTGLEEGGTRKGTVGGDDAYGEWREDMCATIPIESAGNGLEEGMRVQLSNGMTARVVSVTETDVRIDANHELAGKDLTFDVELVKHVPSERMETATFGAGCFWGVELAYQRVPGVLDTCVGYSNGHVIDPTYEDVCSGQSGHAEVVQVKFDPSVVSFRGLLDVLFDNHDPTQVNRQGNDVGTQYRSGIYTSTEEQEAAARAYIEERAGDFAGPIATEVLPVENFTRAEAYHQQYLARGGRFGKPQSAEKGCTSPIRCYG